MVGRPWAAPGAFLYWGQNGLLGGVFLEMVFLAKNGQNRRAAELHRGPGPMTYLDPRFPVLEFSKLRTWSGAPPSQRAAEI